MASVYGPLEAKIQKELSDRMYIELNFKPKTGMPGVAERGKEKLIKTTCNQILLPHLHPRTAINITIQEMQDGGAILSAAINASCLALIDSGIAMQCLVAAVTCLVNEENEIVIDPSRQKVEAGYKAVLTFAFDNRKKELILSHCEGQVASEIFQKCLRQCKEASQVIFDFYKTAIKRKFSKEL